MTWGLIWLVLNIVCAILNAATGRPWGALINGSVAGALLVVLTLNYIDRRAKGAKE